MQEAKSHLRIRLNKEKGKWKKYIMFVPNTIIAVVVVAIITQTHMGKEHDGPLFFCVPRNYAFFCDFNVLPTKTGTPKTRMVM